MSGKSVTIPCEQGSLGGLWLKPRGTRAAFVFAHGAGAGMRHAFMEALAAELARQRIATLRFNFPYMQAGSRRPDPPATAKKAILEAVNWVCRKEPQLPLLAGGKSFGGRMASQLASEVELPVRGLVYCGFPLHPSGKPGTTRARHLSEVHLPQLFLQGTRDKLADVRLIEQVVKKIPHGSLTFIADADHSFGVPKRSGRTAEHVLRQLAETIAGWSRDIV